MVQEKKSVLIIEDNYVDYFLFNELMNEVGANVNIIYAKKLNEALVFLKENQEKVSLIFSDLNLPDANGLEIINGINEINHSKHPIIFLTGHPDDNSLNQIKKLVNTKLMLKDDLNVTSLKDIFSNTMLLKH